MLKRSSRIFLGAATLWPAVYALVYFVVAFGSFAVAAVSGSSMSAGSLPRLATSILNSATIAWAFSLLVVYFALIARSDRLPSSQKVAWMIVVAVGSIPGMLIYWYFYVWRESGEQPASCS